MKIVFYFDYLSPFSFLAWMKMQNLNSEEKKLFEKIEYRPLPMSSLIRLYETKGPAEIPSKRDFLMKVFLRKCYQYDIQLTIPSPLPFNSLYALRMSTLSAFASMELDDSLLFKKREQLIDHLFKSCWLQGLDLSDEKNLASILKKLELSESILEKINSKEARKEIKSTVKEAFSLGAFGVPTWIAFDDNSSTSSHLFWGEDSLIDLVGFLKGQESFDQALYQNYLERFASS